MKDILKNKVFLYITEFIAGISVMAVELGASRLLAPYFSSSQIVWTIIIGTIMIAMAIGNIYGGRSADKNPDPDTLYRRVMIAAIWTSLIPVLGKYVILLISGLVIFSINENFLVIAGFAACFIIFVFPLFLLGTVTPSLVTYTVEDLSDNGKTVGTLGACNTVGSIIGTFLPTFVTIPAVGTSVTFLIFAGMLLAVSVVYFISVKRKLILTAIGVVIFIACCIFGRGDSFAFWETELLYEGESVYNYLQVKEEPGKVLLSTNVLFGVQSVYDKSGNYTGMYYDYDLAALYMSSPENMSDKDVLILGNCCGTYATELLKLHPDINVEGVEIDERITDLAYEYFDMSDKVKVTTYDGRAYLNTVSTKYDVIMVDAYQDITIPFQMSSVEFFTLVKEHLKPGGVMVVNMNMRGNMSDPDKKDADINLYLQDTIAEVFDYVYTVDVSGYTNRELFATDSMEALDNLDKMISSGGNAPDELTLLMKKVRDGFSVYQGSGHIFTDDKAPVELYGMRVIDDLIRDEVDYYKDVYKNEGLKGLIDSF